MEQKNILLGLTGSIAIYKIADLIRRLKGKGFALRVVMTPFAERFVGRMTWETLTGEKTYSDWGDDPLAHINLARWADVFLIAPCSVNTLAKLSLGIADNLLTATFLAYERSVLISPSANPVMYGKKVVEEHIERLKKEGHIIIEPDYGLMACEEEGLGKLPDIERLEDWIHYMLHPKELKGRRVLITCGATREYMDRVRFISNESSGEMGFSLAKVFRWYGAEVKVIAGFTTAKEPYEVYIERVVSANDMLEAVKKHMDWAEIIVMNAAVSDFRPVKVFKGKLKKGQIDGYIKVEITEDILGYISERKGDKLVIGFALETENLFEEARRKLEEKRADYIVVNPAEVMGSTAYEGYIIGRDGTVVEIKEKDKISASEKLVKFLAEKVKFT